MAIFIEQDCNIVRWDNSWSMFVLDICSLRFFLWNHALGFSLGKLKQDYCMCMLCYDFFACSNHVNFSFSFPSDFIHIAANDVFYCALQC